MEFQHYLKYNNLTMDSCKLLLPKGDDRLPRFRVEGNFELCMEWIKRSSQFRTAKKKEGKKENKKEVEEELPVWQWSSKTNSRSSSEWHYARC